MNNDSNIENNRIVDEESPITYIDDFPLTDRTHDYSKNRFPFTFNILHLCSSVMYVVALLISFYVVYNLTKSYPTNNNSFFVMPYQYVNTTFTNTDVFTEVILLGVGTLLNITDSILLFIMCLLLVYLSYKYVRNKYYDDEQYYIYNTRICSMGIKCIKYIKITMLIYVAMFVLLLAQFISIYVGCNNHYNDYQMSICTYYTFCNGKVYFYMSILLFVFLCLFVTICMRT